MYIEETHDVIAFAGQYLKANALSKWKRDLKAAEKNLAGFERLIEKAEIKVEKAEQKLQAEEDWNAKQE